MARGSAAGRGGANRKGPARAGRQASAEEDNAWAPAASAGPGGKRRRSSGGSDHSDSEDNDVTLLYQRPVARRVGRPRTSVTPVGSSHSGKAVVSRRGRSSAQKAVTTNVGDVTVNVVPSVRGRTPHLNASTASGVHGSQISGSPDAPPLRLGAGRTPPEVLLWRRCMSQRNLLRSLENCGLAAAPRADRESAQTHEEALVETLFGLGEDRIQTAIQSLLDLSALALHVPLGNTTYALAPLATQEPRSVNPKGTKGSGKEAQSETARNHPSGGNSNSSNGAGGGGAGGCAWWVEKRLARAVLALAGLCDAAVPTVHPALTTARAAQALETATEYTLTRTPSTGAASGAVRDTAPQAVVVVVPLPVSMHAVRQRLRSLTRIWQLRFSYGLVAPALLRCRSVADLNAFFLPRADAQTPSEDTFVAFPALSSSRHRAEGLVLGELVAQAGRGCAVDTEAWGAMAALGPLKVVAGIYVVQHASRQRALAELLAEEADLYGLPPFLRSIRKTAFTMGGGGLSIGHKSSATPSTGATGSGAAGSKAAARGGIDYSKEHLLFPSLCSLDFRRFNVPDAMQAPLVQEELVALARKHCAVGLLVGEADQITTLLKEASEHRLELQARQALRARYEAQQARLKSERGGDKRTDPCVIAGGTTAAATGEDVVKREAENDDGHEDVSAFASLQSNPRRHDPLLPFARETALRARERRRRCLSPSASMTPPATTTADNDEDGSQGVWRQLCHVSWLCENRWCPSELRPSYYGLVYGVVLKSELLAALDGATPSSAMDADEYGEAGTRESDEARPSGGGSQDVTYYVSAVVELTR